MTDGIVRMDGILAGRWHLANTTIPIAEIRLDRLLWEGAAEDYLYRGLSAEQIASALAFEFPALFEPSIKMLYASFTVGCACGEETAQNLSGFQEVTFTCACNRSWTIALSIRPTESTAPSPDFDQDIDSATITQSSRRGDA